MSPPTPGTLWRCLAPEEEGRGPFVVDGHVIPQGTKVGVNIYSLHHNEVSAYPLVHRYLSTWELAFHLYYLGSCIFKLSLKKATVKIGLLLRSLHLQP